MQDNSENGFQVRIGYSAFSGCSSLKNMRLSENVSYIGEQVFSNTAIESITIPKSVEKCGGDNNQGPFYNCKTLEEIIFEEGTTKIADNICVSHGSASYLKKVVIPETVTTIGGNAFEGCNSLTDIELPAGLKEIGYDAFSDCSNLKSVTILESVTRIGNDAFNKCDKLTIQCVENSYAHTYAIENDIPVKFIDSNVTSDDDSVEGARKTNKVSKNDYGATTYQSTKDGEIQDAALKFKSAMDD